MGRGRRTKLTPEVKEKICDNIRQGVPYETAAALAGIDISTFYRWLERGKKARGGLYCDFCDAVKKAESDAEATLLGYIRSEAQKGTWQASAWILERRHPQRWARRERIEHEHSVGDALARILEGLAHQSSQEDD